MNSAAVLLLLYFLGLQAFIEARPPAAEPALEAVNIVKRQSDGDWDSPRGGGSYGGRGSDGDWDAWYFSKPKTYNDGWWP
ncbi:unnamed protein product [Bursaphelenchus xylophilus]|uniref:(pine wood nematode) hypothetical protein n=1 Tax=Bursaphelenchus xylophilus TaxID=6326 RepID=A0A1I7RM79_BURXY|nr:unnamed protein product [Bursaphelenchus xylophilus]CAG9118276.1 unnamed protein product [Bursaphelenchus xylophilus]